MHIWQRHSRKCSAETRTSRKSSNLCSLTTRTTRPIIYLSTTFSYGVVTSTTGSTPRISTRPLTKSRKTSSESSESLINFFRRRRLAMYLLNWKRQRSSSRPLTSSRWARMTTSIKVTRCASLLGATASSSAERTSSRCSTQASCRQLSPTTSLLPPSSKSSTK